MKYESTSCTRCGGSSFISFCKNCGDLEERDERIRREAADRAVEYIATGNYGSDTALRAAIMGEAKK